MERFLECQQEANKKIGIAEHLLTQTYPLIRDTRLLLTVVNNVFSALDNSMSALLYIERYYKRIPPFQDTFESKLNAFRYNVIDRYNINREFLLLVNDVAAIMKAHKNSPVEFSRKDKFVICTGNYQMQEITIERLKGYILKTKEFIDIINRMVNQYGRIN